jgi:hypothetical protein
MRFRPFMEEQLSKGFDDFVTLYFPGPKKPWEYQSDRELLMASLRDRTNDKAREARLRRLDLAKTAKSAGFVKSENTLPASSDT